MGVGSGTIGAVWLRVRECQLLSAFAVVDKWQMIKGFWELIVKTKMIMHSISEKKTHDQCNNHKKGHINTNIMCLFTLMRASC